MPLLAATRMKKYARHNVAASEHTSSSRSHCIFTLQVDSKEKADGGFVMTRTGKLHMVDLAGSECAKSAGTEDAKQERERKNINTLSAPSERRLQP